MWSCVLGRMFKLENLSADWMKCGRPANRYEQHAVRGYSKFAVLNFLLLFNSMWQTDEREVGTTLVALPKCGNQKKSIKQNPGIVRPMASGYLAH
jgi:hypothetical protein